MAMKEIITVKVPTVQVGDILCGTTWSKDEGTGTAWTPAHKIVGVAGTNAVVEAHYTTWWLVTECLESGYQDDLGPFGTDDELHVVARSAGDALIGRGKHL
ncbi:MAG: hypothetical protein CL489_03410 [Acidobacteria bacterium]|nr:hypothetical protein [Acidobacteriota bacterium]